MRPANVSTAGVGASALIPLDINKAPFAVGFGARVSGTVTYTVQHTFDDIFAPGFNPATAVWFNHPTVNNATANADSNYAFPVRAIRVNQTAGTGSVALTAIQAGPY